jgi:hypothetical protein
LVIGALVRICYAFLERRPTHPLGHGLADHGDALILSAGRLAARDPAKAARLAALVRSASDTAAGTEGSAGGAVALARAEGLAAERAGRALPSRA